MPRPKRQQPYDPSKIHDRRTTDKLKDAQLAALDVDDPYEPGAKIRVMRSTRDDPLANLHAGKHIDDAQYEGGRAFQRDFETAERGPRAIDPSKEAVDGGMPPEAITEGQQKAAKRLARVYRALGVDGSALAHDVLVYGLTMARVGVRRGLTGKHWEEYFGKRFRECLHCLAEVYGFSMKKN